MPSLEQSLFITESEEFSGNHRYGKNYVALLLMKVPIMNLNRILYLSLSIIGLFTTWYFNFQFMAATDTSFATFDIVQFVKDGFATPAAASLSSDLFVGGGAATVFIIAEGRRLRINYWWIFLILNVVIAFAFAFPLFLMVREQKLTELRGEALTSS